MGPWKRPVLLRLAIPVVAFLVYYGFVRYSIARSADSTHHGDTGLGLALLLGFACFALILGYLYDFVRQMRHRRRALVVADLAVLAVLLTPFGWVGCNWFGVADDAVCRIPIRIFGALLAALGL